MKKKLRIVILGGGFGGLVTAILLARKSKKHEILIIDREGTHVYTPWMYELATSFLINSTKTQLRELRKTSQFKLKDIIKTGGYRNIDVRIAEVEDIDSKSKHVILKGGKTVSFDKLVVALGSQISYFGIDSIEKYSSTLKTIDNALETRDKIEKLLEICQREHQIFNVVIVGAGATGVECASEFANYLKSADKKGICDSSQVQISMIDAGASLLFRFPKFIQSAAERRFKKLGINSIINARVQGATESKLKILQDKKVKEVPYDVFVWAGGIQSNSINSNFRLPKDERGLLLTRQTLQVEGCDDIYAIGDTIAYTDTRSGQRAPATAWAATDQAKIVSHNILHNKKKNYHLPIRFPASITLGGATAVSSLYGLPVFGRIAFWLRRVIDLHYFITILPFIPALKVWRKGCSVLSKND